MYQSVIFSGNEEEVSEKVKDHISRLPMGSLVDVKYTSASYGNSDDIYIEYSALIISKKGSL